MKIFIKTNHLVPLDCYVAYPKYFRWGSYSNLCLFIYLFIFYEWQKASGHKDVQNDR